MGGSQDLPADGAFLGRPPGSPPSRHSLGGPRAPGAARAGGLPSPSANLPAQHTAGGGPIGGLSKSATSSPRPTPPHPAPRSPGPEKTSCPCPGPGGGGGVPVALPEATPTEAHTGSGSSLREPTCASWARRPGEKLTLITQPLPAARVHRAPGTEAAPRGPRTHAGPGEQRFRPQAPETVPGAGGCRHQLISRADGGRTRLGPSARPRPHTPVRLSQEWERADAPPGTSRARSVCMGGPPTAATPPGHRGQLGRGAGGGQRTGQALALKAPTPREGCPMLSSRP